MVIGATYAYFMLLISNPEDSTDIYTGTLIAEFSQGEVIDDQSFYPRSEATLEDLKYAYSNSFSVTNTGTLDGIMEIKLEISKNGFSDGAIKYALYNSSGNKITTGDVVTAGDVVLLDNVLINAKESAEYTLVLWLQESGEQQNIDEDKRLTATIVAELVQNIQ